MTETVKIVDFLKCGKFGNSNDINYGMSRNQIVEVLGESTDVFYSFKKSKFPSIYKYGKIEFYFEEGKEGRLYGIQLKPTIVESPLLNLKVDYGFINEDLKHTNAKKLLELNSIEYTEFSFKYDEVDDPQRIITEGKVIFVFDSDYNIQKVYRFIELESNKPEMKQISLSIPKSQYEILRKEALHTGISIQNICKKYILDKLKE